MVAFIRSRGIEMLEWSGDRLSVIGYRLLYLEHKLSALLIIGFKIPPAEE